MKDQQAKGFLNSLGLKFILSKVPMFGDIFSDLLKCNYGEKLC